MLDASAGMLTHINTSNITYFWSSSDETDDPGKVWLICIFMRCHLVTMVTHLCVSMPVQVCVCFHPPPSPSLKVQHVRILIEIINKLNDFDLKTFMYCVVRDVY